MTDSPYDTAPDATARPIGLPNPLEGWRGAMLAPLLAMGDRLIGLHRFRQLADSLRGRDRSRGPGEAWGRAMRIRVETELAPLRSIPREGPIVFVANHAMGGPDAIGLAALAEQIRPDTRFVVNRLLSRMPRIGERSFEVDAFGGPDAARRNARGLRQAAQHLAAGGALAVFPSGEVSHLTWNRRNVTDPPWNPIVARLVERSRASVVPVFFHGRNRWIFQAAGLVHPRLRTALLPRETLAAIGRTVRCAVGSPIPWEQLAELESAEAVVEYLRARTYMLRERQLDRTSLVNLIEPLPPMRPTPVRPKSRSGITASGAPLAAHPLSPPGRFAEEIESLPVGSVLLQHRDWDVIVGRRSQLPKVVEEIGRLREIAFREVGEGTGRRLDLDRFDDTYLHLFLWDRRHREVLGAYRLGATDEILPAQGLEGLYTHTLFEYGEGLMSQISPALELGRSFVRPEYQRHPATLMLLWKGIGRFLAANPRYRMMFGPVSISNAYRSMSRRLLIAFLSAAPRLSSLVGLIRPRHPVAFEPVRDFNEAGLKRVAADLDEVDRLVREIEANQRTVPVLLRQYLKLNAKLLGFNIDPDFHDCLDGLMLVDLLECDARIMDQYMGRDGAAAFMAHHRGAGASSAPGAS
ncbi:MAG: lysophospholipid acyltransferase family protein [Planctomycetota bacterium]|jgi:putative hemolysin